MVGEGNDETWILGKCELELWTLLDANLSVKTFLRQVLLWYRDVYYESIALVVAPTSRI